MYQWKAFKTLEEAKQFKGENKRGVIYDLNKDRKRVERGRPPMFYRCHLRSEPGPELLRGVDRLKFL